MGLTSYHMCGGGTGNKGHPRITSFAVQGQTIHTLSVRASNYFVSGEDDMKPGSIPGDTLLLIILYPTIPLLVKLKLMRKSLLRDSVTRYSILFLAFKMVSRTASGFSISPTYSKITF